MAGNLLVRISDSPIDHQEAIDFVADPAAGAICLFCGTVRDHSEAGEVTGLQYEAWEELASKRMQEICDEMISGWPVRKVAILHRYGDLAVGDTSVAVACSTPHRDQAFEACRHGIDRLKQDVPIWKKEILATGEAEWVSGS